MIGALAILGAILNAWVFSVHVASTALTSLGADHGFVVVCGQGGTVTLADLGIAGEKPLSKKHCPICSGLASLHVGILSEPGFEIARFLAPALIRSDAIVMRVIDRRPRELFNRGPPDRA
ncbi:MAG: hypothetical protein QM780_04365 [Hyphomicrobium sp.]|uniref:hypothetical protein n=1 Tax=Hyphomicrobium sp. TaxID=82 RepID=UPI0039E57A52